MYTMRCLALRSDKTRLEPEATCFRGLGTQQEKTRPESSTTIVFFDQEQHPGGNNKLLNFLNMNLI